MSDLVKIKIVGFLTTRLISVFVSFRVVGFEELGNTDNFPTEVLERRIANSGSTDCTLLSQYLKF